MGILNNIMKKFDSQLSVAQAKELLQEGAVLIDVRTPAEFSESHSTLATNIPLDTIEDSINMLPKDKVIIVHCRSGMRSGQAISKIKASTGRTDVYNLGGIDKALQL